MKIIFFGTDDFAVTNLEGLMKSGHEVVLCIAPADQRKGRGMKLEHPPVKRCALKHKLEVFQPENLKDPAVIEKLKSCNCDLFVVIAYGKILPPQLLQIPYLCAMNVHASLLPKYRGAAPINWAIINGETETGVSIIKMNARMDAGDIFAQAKCAISGEETSVTLRKKLADLGADLLMKTVGSLENNNYTLTVQDSRSATYAPKLSKDLGRIDWRKKAAEIHNLVRGLLPWPGAYTIFQGKMLKILETKVLDQLPLLSRPGEVINVAQNGLVVAACDRPVLIKTVHFESSNSMQAYPFALGHHVKAGDKLE